MEQIERNAETPYYQQLAAILERRIRGGEYLPNDPLPSESDLCRTFDLSRSTVRETLRALQQQRLIRMVPRRGAFVADHGDERGWILQVTSGFFELEAERAARRVDTRVLGSGFLDMPDEVCARLDLPAGSRGFRLERTRALDGRMVLHSVNWLPEHVGRLLAGRPVLTGAASLNAALREVGFLIHGAKRDVSAVAADEVMAQHLGVEPQTPLLLVESVSWGEDERPFDCYLSHLRSDRLKVSVEARAVPEDR